MKSKISNIIKESLNFLKVIANIGLKLTGKVFKTLLVTLIATGVVVIGVPLFIGYQIGKKVYNNIKERKKEKKKSINRDSKVELNEDLSLDIEQKVENSEHISIDTVKPYTYSQVYDSINYINGVIPDNLLLAVQVNKLLREYAKIRRTIETTTDKSKLEELQRNITIVSFQLNDLLKENNSKDLDFEKQEVVLKKTA